MPEQTLTIAEQLDELARIVTPGLGTAALAGPLLQAISNGAHAEHGMIAVAIVAMVLGAGARRSTRRVEAALTASALFMAASCLLTLVSSDAGGPAHTSGSSRLYYSMISAFWVAVALAPLYHASARGRRTESPDSVTGGAWLLSIAAGAVPESWWIARAVISVYTVVAAATVVLGLTMVAAGLRRGRARPSLRQLATFAVAAAIAHLGMTFVFTTASTPPG